MTPGCFLLGHEQVRRGLIDTTDRSGPAAAYLFLGESGLGKERTALWLAARLNCAAPTPDGPCGACPSCRKVFQHNHPDVLVQRREAGKTGIGVGDVREGIAAASYRPYEGRCRVWIVSEAELLTDEAQNALLKTLEEPPGSLVVILVSCSEPAMLPTVTSRCRPIRFLPLALPELEAFLLERGVEPERASVLARLAQGRPGKALQLLENAGLWELRDTTLKILSQLPGAGLWPALSSAARLEALRSSDEARASLGVVLETARSWYRDLLYLAAGGPESEVVNVDHRDELQRLSAEGGVRRARQGLDRLLEAHEHYRSNANARLLLQRLCLHLAR
ncbi:MAG: DNA polymerase III subunit delta' [Candidatus Eremiobacterota bacterium]